MGADKAVHVTDLALHGLRRLVTSAVLAQVLSGSASTRHPRLGVDRRRMGVMAAMLAERLGVPQLSLAGQVDIDGASISIHRQAITATTRSRRACPRWSAWSRRSTSRATRRSRGSWRRRKKPVETLSLPTFGLDKDQVGVGASATEVVSFASRPPRQAGTIVTDDGDGGTKAAEFLAAQKFI